MTSTAKEYAIALFSLAMESGTAAEISQGLKLIVDAFRETPELSLYLRSPAIPKAQRLETIDRAFSDAVPVYACSFVSMLCEHGLIDQLETCVREYERLYRDSLNRHSAVVTSAVALTQAERNRLQKQLENRFGRRTDIDYRVDPALLGGLIIESDGTILDGSLKHRLQTMKEALEP